MALNLTIATRNLFATPVAAVRTPDAPARNEALRALILQRRAQFPSMQASNAGGWHSSRDLLSWGGVAAAEIAEMARVVATHMTRDRAGAAVRPDWTITCWANVNRAGDSNFSHYHPGAFWSGTYYVDDGGPPVDAPGDSSTEPSTDPSTSGLFEMLDPRGSAPAMLAPTLAYAGEGGTAAGMTETIEPRPGLLFLFPSWLHHQVRPHRGAGLRISVAFNLRP